MTRAISTYRYGPGGADSGLLDGADWDALDEDDWLSPRGRALFAAIEADPEIDDGQKSLGLLPDGRWAISGRSRLGDYRFAVESQEPRVRTTIHLQLGHLYDYLSAHPLTPDYVDRERTELALEALAEQALQEAYPDADVSAHLGEECSADCPSSDRDPENFEPCDVVNRAADRSTSWIIPMRSGSPDQ